MTLASSRDRTVTKSGKMPAAMVSGLTPEEEAIVDRIEASLLGALSDLFMHEQSERTYLGTCGSLYVTHQEQEKLLVLKDVSWNGWQFMRSQRDVFKLEARQQDGSRILYSCCAVKTAAFKGIGTPNAGNNLELYYETGRLL